MTELGNTSENDGTVHQNSDHDIEVENDIVERQEGENDNDERQEVENYSSRQDETQTTHVEVQGFGDENLKSTRNRFKNLVMMEEIRTKGRPKSKSRQLRFNFNKTAADRRKKTSKTRKKPVSNPYHTRQLIGDSETESDEETDSDTMRELIATLEKGDTDEDLSDVEF